MSTPTINYQLRFGGIERLYGAGSLDRIRDAHALVVGIGGVGSWVVEALARSGVGKLTLVDLDDVCESNMNRQIHALDNTIGRLKIETMAERVRLINPNCEIRSIPTFLTAKTLPDIFDTRYDYVMDAIDSVNHKCSLIDYCYRARIPVLVSGGAGGRIDPCRIQIADLSKSYNDKLLQRVRRKLRQDHAFPKNPEKRFDIECVFSPEEARLPDQCETESTGVTSRRLDCSGGYGAATHITGVFGFIAAARIIEKISQC